MKDIDVVMITLNSLEPCLERSLESICKAAEKSQISVRLIVVDGGSTDGTLELIESYSNLHPLIIMDSGNRATARQKGMNIVRTPLFAFIDSDVELPLNWFKEIIPYFCNPKVGAVWGAALQTSPKKKKYFEAMAKLYRSKPIDMMKKYGEIRGCLHDTMIRKEAIKGINIPPEFHVMEDHYLRINIEKRGWKWISTTTPYALHNMGEDPSLNAYLDAYYGWKLGVYNLTWYIKHFFLSWVKLSYLLIATRDFNLVKHEAIKEKEFFKASLSLLKEAIL